VQELSLNKLPHRLRVLLNQMLRPAVQFGDGSEIRIDAEIYLDISTGIMPSRQRIT
jgi:hypothetical protein